MVTEKAPKGQEFHLASGDKVENIEQLQKYLEQASDEDYSHHVSEDRNDFAEWVRNVHNKEALAKKLENTRGRREAVKVLRRAVMHHYDKKTKEVGQVLKAKKKQKENKKEDKDKGKNVHHISSEHGEFIRKEFIYGFLFGLVLGVLAYAVLQNLL